MNEQKLLQLVECKFFNPLIDEEGNIKWNCLLKGTECEGCFECENKSLVCLQEVVINEHHK